MRLVNVLHTDKKLTLVFEYLDQDLKKLIDKNTSKFEPEQVKVRGAFKFKCDCRALCGNYWLVLRSATSTKCYIGT